MKRFRSSFSTLIAPGRFCCTIASWVFWGFSQVVVFHISSLMKVEGLHFGREKRKEFVGREIEASIAGDFAGFNMIGPVIS